MTGSAYQLFLSANFILDPSNSLRQHGIEDTCIICRFGLGPQVNHLGATGVDRTWAVDSGTVGTWAYRSPIPALSANLAVADMVVVRPHTDRLDAEVDASVFRSVLPESAQVSLKSFRTSSIADVDRCQQSQLAARFACESLDVRLPSGDRRQLMPGLRRPAVQQAGTLARLVSTLNSPPEVSSPQPETRPESFQPQTAGTTLPPPATTFQP